MTRWQRLRANARTLPLGCCNPSQGVASYMALNGTPIQCRRSSYKNRAHGRSISRSSFNSNGKGRTMAQKRSSGGARRGSPAQSKQRSQQGASRQMGQSGSGTGRRQQGEVRSPEGMPPTHQSGTGEPRRQQSSQNIEETEAGYGSFKRRRDETTSDDVEREGLSTGNRDDDIESEPR